MKTLPDHGTRSRYLQGCRCDACGDANYRYMSRWRLDDQRGRRRRTDATQPRVHILRLLANGWTRAQVARTSGVAESVVKDVASGRPTITTRNAAAILNMPIGPPPSGRRDVDATGTVRRLRALMSIGHSLECLAGQVGMHRTGLSVIVNGAPRSVRATTAADVARLYRKLSHVPGTNNRARHTAARNGWHGPAAWDDIDDPSAQPETDEPSEELSRSEGAFRRAEIEHLARFGLGHEQIAARLGMAPGYVRDIVRELRTGRAA